MAARDDSRDRFTGPQLTLFALAALGLVGAIVTIVLANANPAWSRGWATLLTAGFLAMMLGSLFAAGLVPDSRAGAYRSLPVSDAERAWIPEFLPDEAVRMRFRRVIVHVALVLSLLIWLLCWGIPIGVLLSQTEGNMNADVDPTGYLVWMAVGAAALVVYCVIQAILPQLTTQNAHLRSLRAALTEATVQPNRTSASLSWMVRNTTPGVRARPMGTTYLAISGEVLSVWRHGRGRLTKALETPLASITRVDYLWVSLGIAGVQGVAVETTALTRPLELCPLDHVLDWGASARRLGRRLSATPNETVPSHDK